MSTIPSPRVPEGNYFPAWILPADSTSHIETHFLRILTAEYPTLANLTLFPVAF